MIRIVSFLHCWLSYPYRFVVLENFFWCVRWYTNVGNCWSKFNIKAFLVSSSAQVNKLTYHDAGTQKFYFWVKKRCLQLQPFSQPSHRRNSSCYLLFMMYIWSNGAISKASYLKSAKWCFHTASSGQMLIKETSVKASFVPSSHGDCWNLTFTSIL